MHFIMCLGFSKVLQETEIYQLLNFNVIFACCQYKDSCYANIETWVLTMLWRIDLVQKINIKIYFLIFFILSKHEKITAVWKGHFYEQ